MLESYIAPLLLSYVDKYIKNLKPGDLSLSIWGGDVVLQNLELNLEVLHKEINLPITFFSGRIHQLRIHVPWTRLMSEPVVITIDTIEFISKLTDSESSNPDSPRDKKHEEELSKAIQKVKQRDTEQLPPGYVQSLLNKVINNVSIKINNLVLKYVEDDIVLSLSIKALDVFSVNKNWERHFTDLSANDLKLRRVCKISDLTLCLDQRNASGKIEMYQDPLLYKCSCTCRILSSYEGLHSTSPSSVILNFYCENVDLSITDTQLPMILRLLQLIIGIYYGTLDLPDCEHKLHPAGLLLQSESDDVDGSTVSSDSDVVLKEADDGWVSWAWSYIPGANSEVNLPMHKTEPKSPTEVRVGIYVSQISTTIKLTDQITGGSLLGGQRFVFSPILTIELSGCALEAEVRGIEFFGLEIIVSSIVGYCVGECSCLRKHRSKLNTSMDNEEEKSCEDVLFAKLGDPERAGHEPFAFLRDSLFASYLPVESQETHPITHDVGAPKETQAIQAADALFFAYLYEMEFPTQGKGEKETDVSSVRSVKVKEQSQKKIVIGPSIINIGASLVHRWTELVNLFKHEYPSRKEKKGVFQDPFAMKQTEIGNYSTRHLQLTVQPSMITVLCKDHTFGNHNEQDGPLDPLGIQLQMDRLDFQKADPMYPVELTAHIRKLQQSRGSAVRAAFSDLYVKIFGFQAGLCLYEEEDSAPVNLNIVPPTYASFYVKSSILDASLVQKLELSSYEVRIESPSLMVSLTKAQLLLLFYIFQSWTSPKRMQAPVALTDDVFHPGACSVPTGAHKKNHLSILEGSLIGIQCKLIKTAAFYSLSGSVGSAKLTLQTLRDARGFSCPVFYGPLNTSIIGNVDQYLRGGARRLEEMPNGALLQFNLQMPTENCAEGLYNPVIVELKGMAVYVDPDVIGWLLYHPAVLHIEPPKRMERRFRKMMSRTFSSSTPKKKSYARAFTSAGATLKQSRPKEGEQPEPRVWDETEENIVRGKKWSWAIAALQSLVVQVHMEPLALYVAKDRIPVDSASSLGSFNIPLMMQESYVSATTVFPDVLVVVSPQLELTSANTKVLGNAWEVPCRITATEHDLKASLPWSLNGSGFSVYTLRGQALNNRRSPVESLGDSYILYPSDWRLFCTATFNFSQPSQKDSFGQQMTEPLRLLNLTGSEDDKERRISTLTRGLAEQKIPFSVGLSVHADLASIRLSLSLEQIKLIGSICSEAITVLKGISLSGIQSNLSKPHSVLRNQVDLETKSGSHQRMESLSHSSSSTMDPLEMAAGSTSESKVSVATDKPSDRSGFVILWLQWTIPKLSFCTHGPLEQGGCLYKVETQFDEMSFALDRKEDEIQLMSKVASCTIKHYKRSFSEKEWQPGAWGGVLFSDQDLLYKGAGFLTRRESTIRTFLSVTYSRKAQVSSEKRKRLVSNQSYDTLGSAETKMEKVSEVKPTFMVTDSDSYKHQCSVTLQPFDAVVVLEPFLAVSHMVSCIQEYFGNTGRPENEDAIVKMEARRMSPVICNEATMSPLPECSISLSEVRVLVPKWPKLSSEESSDGGKGFANCSGEDCLLLQVQSVTLTTNPENHLTQTCLHKDWHRAVRRHFREKGMHHRKGRQYQLNIHGIGFWTACVAQLFNKVLLKVEERSGQPQIPAADWNKEERNQAQTQFSITPLLEEFDLYAVLAPPLLLQRNTTLETIVVNSGSVEVHVTKDVQILLNQLQIGLLVGILEVYSSKLTKKNADFNMFGIEEGDGLTSPGKVDSGFSSDRSKPNNMVKTDRRKSPETIPIELFTTASKLSVILYRVGEDPVSQPLLTLVTIQPSVLLLSYPHEIRIEGSVYDFCIKRALVDEYRQLGIPSENVFRVPMFATSKGAADHKTGLYAPFCNFLMEGQSQGRLKVEVGRPICISLDYDFIQLCLDAWKEVKSDVLVLVNMNNDSLGQQGDPKRAEDEAGLQPQDHKVTETNRVQSFVLSSLEVNLKELELLIQPCIDPKATTLGLYFRSLKSKMNLPSSRGGRQSVSAYSLNHYVEGLSLYLKREYEKHHILLPTMLQTEVWIDFFQHKGSDQVLRAPTMTSIWLDTGMLRLELGQEHVSLVEDFTSQFTAALEALNLGNTGEVKAECTSEDSAFVEEEVVRTKDDLKTELFSYVMETGDDLAHPEPHQVLFSTDKGERPPCMTWRYAEPRFLSKVEVMPLPFSLDTFKASASYDEQLKVPCVLRAWDPLQKCFVTCKHFFLSETKADTISFADPCDCKFGSESSPLSEVWQVVIDVAIEVPDHASFPESEDGHSIFDDVTTSTAYSPLVASTSLAACLKISSCFVPSKIPTLSLMANIGTTEVRLINMISPEKLASPDYLTPYFLEQDSYCSSHEVVCIRCENLTSKAQFWNKDKRMVTELDLDLSVSILNYKNLKWQRFLSPCSLHFDVESADGVTQFGVDVGTAEFTFSQSTVHTISHTAHAWKTKQEERSSADVRLPFHYVICNDTEEVIRLGQTETDEDIILTSGQLYPYSWRSTKKQQLHLCLDSVGDWKWTLPFSIDEVTHMTRAVQHTTYKSSLIIEVKELGRVQRQVTVMGNIQFKNYLDMDVEVQTTASRAQPPTSQFQQPKAIEVVNEFLVPKSTTRPSIVIAHELLRFVAVRKFIEGPTADSYWSKAIDMTQAETSKDVMVPLELKTNDKIFHCWFCILWPLGDKLLQLVLCPFFILRNHLPFAIAMTAEVKNSQRAEKQETRIVGNGRGEETQVHFLQPLTWYDVTFMVEDNNNKSNPPIPVNTSICELIRGSGTMDSFGVCYKEEWPYTDVIEDHKGTEKQQALPSTLFHSMQAQRNRTASTSGSSSANVNVDLSCQLQLWWPKLPSIVIEVKPTVLFVNLSSAIVFLRMQEERLFWELKQGKTACPPLMQNSFAIGVLQGDDRMMFWSSELSLTTGPVVGMNSSEGDLTVIFPGKMAHCSLLSNENRKVCFQFALSCTKVHEIFVLCIKERFCFHNETDLPLSSWILLKDPTVEEEYDFYNETAVPIYGCLEASQSRVALACKEETPPNQEDLVSFSLLLLYKLLSTVSKELWCRLDLSSEHLRESALIEEGDTVHPVAITTMMDEGVIHIYYAKETMPYLTLFNTCAFCVTVREASTKEHQIDARPMHCDIPPSQVRYMQVTSLKRNFPKLVAMDSPALEFSCLSFVASKSFSSPVTLQDGLNKKVHFPFVIDETFDSLFVSVTSSSNCFTVVLREHICQEPVETVRLPIPQVSCTFSSVSMLFVDDITFSDRALEVFAVRFESLTLLHEHQTPTVDVPSEVPKSFAHKEGEIRAIKHLPSNLKISFGCLQIDNQLLEGFCNFPVILHPLRAVSDRYHSSPIAEAPFADSKASEADVFFRLDFTLVPQPMSDTVFISEVHCHVEPMEIYLEDTFIYHLIQLIHSYRGESQRENKRRPRFTLSPVSESLIHEILYPLYVGRIAVDEVQILLSIHASVKVFIAADHMPVVLGSLQSPPCITVTKELVRHLLYHYATQILVRAGWMIGSLEIIGNPTGLIRSIGQGISDFVYFPYDGITRGPSAFIRGIGKGLKSFLRHISGGALTSMTNFASSMSRNMDRLSLDEQHLLWQEELRSHPANHMTAGLRQALGCFGLSILGAIAGLVEHPLQNIQNATDAKSAVKGTITGLGKGIIGVVTKPLGGAMELVSQTGQGILQGTGLIKTPVRIREPRVDQLSLLTGNESHLHFLWRLLQLQDPAGLFVVDRAFISHSNEDAGYDGAVLLTPTTIYLYDSEAENITQALICTEVTIEQDLTHPHIAYIHSKRDASKGFGTPPLSNADVNPNFEQFFTSLNQIASSQVAAGLSGDYPISAANRTTSIQTDPVKQMLFVSQFNEYARIAEERMTDQLQAARETFSRIDLPSV